MNAGGSAGGDGRTAYGAVIQRDLDLNGGVAAGVQDLAGHNINDFEVLFHGLNKPPKKSGDLIIHERHKKRKRVLPETVIFFSFC